MTVVVYQLNEENNFEELGRSYSDGQTDEALFGIYPEKIWEEESDKWLVERLDGPYVVGEILEEEPDEAEKRLEKFWTEYTGPQGGEGWQNLLTGEVRYQDHQPTSDEDYDHGEDVREPEKDSAFSGYEGISDGSFIRDHMPVTTKFSDEEGQTHYGEIVRADVGGFKSEFVIAAANGKHYHVEEDNIEGYIEPDPEWDPENDNEDRMWQSQFEDIETSLGPDVIPGVPSRNMGNGADPPEADEFNHIGNGKITEEHVRVLQNAIETGDLEGISVDFEATGNDVSYGPWDRDITEWHNGGQFAHVDVEMPIGDFLATQATMLADDRDHPVQAHRSFYGSARSEDVREYAETLEEEPGEMPMPFIEIGKHGRLRNYQEGRHRALAAAYAGHDTLPVRMVINSEREGKREENRVQWPRVSEKFAKGWIPYRGPQGGEGWQSAENPKDVRYQEEPPGEIESGYEEQAEDWGENRVEIPEKFEDEYEAEDITGMDELGDPADWDGEFPFSEGQTLLGNAWEWEIQSLWTEPQGEAEEPHMEAEIGTGISHELGYVSDESKLGDLEPGWYKNPSIPSESNRKDFVGVVGEPEPQETGFDPSDAVAEQADFDLDEAAENMAESVREEKWDNTAAKEYAADLIGETNANYQTLVEITEHGLEASGDSVDHSRDITDAEEIALNGVKKWLHRQAEDHPTLDGKLSLGFVSEELHDDFQSRMTDDTRAEVSDVMQSWVDGFGSMVDEETIPLYALADEIYDNDFYPTRDDVEPLLEETENLEERKEKVDRYRKKTQEVFREQWGDTVPVFRGYNPNRHTKGEEAREALQSEDGPDTIEIRNGVANSWSTDPTVAYQFSQWTNNNGPGVVVRQELPVDQIFGSSDTAPDLMGKETEIIAGNPEEISEYDRSDVFLPEEFDALEQAQWAIEQAQGDADGDEEKSKGDTLRLDWELSSVGWMNEHEALSDVLLSKHWLPIEDDEYRYQHTNSGEMVVGKNFGFSETGAKAGYYPAQNIISKGRLSKKWIPYEGPQGGEGWQNVNHPNDIRYQEDPPGEVAEGYEDMAEDWGDYGSDNQDRIQGARVMTYSVENSENDLRIPENFTIDDVKQTLRRFRNENEGNLSDELADVMIRDSDLSWESKTDILRATTEVFEEHPDDVGQFNDLLHDHIRDNPNADFDVPFGVDGPTAHDLLENAFGPHSDIVSDLEEAILFNEDRDEGRAKEWIKGAQQWIRLNGDRQMADEFQELLNQQESENPFEGVQADIPDHMDPAKAERVTPISVTEADTGISADSMFIAEFEDGSRAFITNTSWERADPDRGISEESTTSAQRAMAGYNAFKVADMEVPQHEHVQEEYWTVEEAPGTPAKDWNGDPQQIDRDQFYKLGAVGMLSGNWDLHGGNVFVTDEGKLIPVDLDLSGHMMTDEYRRDTSWGRLKRLGDKLDLFNRTDSDAVEAMKYGVARKTQELVEEGVADDIKSMASRIEHNGLQMNIEENVFAAKDGRLYDDDVKEPPTKNSDADEDGSGGIMDEMRDDFDMEDS